MQRPSHSSELSAAAAAEAAATHNAAHPTTVRKTSFIKLQ